LKCIKFPIKQDTTISPICPDRNFSNSRELLLSSNMENGLNRILLKFPLNFKNIMETKNIKSAKLYLKCIGMNGDLMDIALYRNTKNFNYKDVTFNTKPTAEVVSTNSKISKTSKGIYLEVDITKLITEWIDLEVPNYGIQLRGIGEKLRMTFASSRTQCEPFVQVIFDERDKPDDRGGLRGMQLQAKNQNTVIIENHAPVIFDSMLYKDDGFEYNQVTGEIIVIRSGRYHVDWSVSIGGSEEVKNISFSLQSIDNLIDVKASIENPMSGMVVGTAFFNISNTPKVFRINNTSGGKVQLLNEGNSVQANFTIFRGN
jgi:desulfoferrodoxin (superoxide reductase-like protein)